MLQLVVSGDAFQFILDYPLHLLLDAVVILLYHLFHAVITVFISKIGNDGDGFICLCLG